MMKNDNYDRVRMLSFADLGDERGRLNLHQLDTNQPVVINR